MKLLSFFALVPPVLPLFLGLVSTGCSTSPEVRSSRFLAGGKAHLAKKDYARAVLDFRNAVRLNPKDPDAHYQLAFACFYANDGQCALSNASKAIELNPSHTAARVLQTQILAAGPESSMIRAAEELAQSIVAATPDPLVFDSLALAEIRLGKLDEAEKHLIQALDRFPAHLSLSVKFALLKFRQRDFAGAEKVLRDAVNSDRNSPAPAVALGSLLLIRGDLPAAEAQFRAALSLNPSEGAALFNLVGIQYRLGRRSEAMQTLQRLSELPDENYRPLRAVYLFQTGDRDKAIDEFKRLYSARKDDRQALSHLVTAYAIAGRLQEAIDILNQELTKNGANVDALLLRARIYLHMGDLDNAESDLLPVLSSRFQSGEAHYLQAAVCAARGQTRRRKAELFEALKIDPRNVKARLEISQLLLAGKAAAAASDLLDGAPADQRHLPAIVLQKNWARLARGEQAEVERDVNLLLAQERAPEAVLQKAVLAFWRKDYGGASQLAEEVLRQKPGDVRAMELVFKVHAAQNQAATGIAKLKDHAFYSRKSAPAQFFLGVVLKSTGDAAGARSAFENTLRADPNFLQADTELALLDQQTNSPESAYQRLLRPAAKNDPTALLMAADLDYRAGRMEKALEGYRKVVGLDPENVTALNNLAFLLAELSRDLETALHLAQQAKTLDAENPAIDHTLGWVQYQKGSFKPAIASFERAISRQPTARRMYHLAMAQFRAGNQAKGLEVYAKAYKLDPKLPEASAMAAASHRGSLE